ncbi:MAG: hypothetical protein FJ138_12275 [Deltaproteobacteria bacterium]|nr:hypothetical protein [Deltaproteobacteria bacterium]
MSALNASPLHLIAGLINAPLFHRDVRRPPPEVTMQCIRLMAQLGRDEEFAYRVNSEMMSFLSQTSAQLDDAAYVRTVRYFTRQLQTVIKGQDLIWGAIAHVMVSMAARFTVGEEREVWARLCGLLFDVFHECELIPPEQAARLTEQTRLGGAAGAAGPASPSPEEGERLTERLAEAERARSEENRALSLLGGGELELQERLRRAARARGGH